VFGNSIPDRLSVTGNSMIGGNLQVHDNQVKSLFPANIIVVQQNTHVGGNILVSNNTASGGPPRHLVIVLDNTASGILGCEGNTPAATGGSNTAALKTGECANL
jgi:hypothetical protein